MQGSHVVGLVVLALSCGACSEMNDPREDASAAASEAPEVPASGTPPSADPASPQGGSGESPAGVPSSPQDPVAAGGAVSEDPPPSTGPDPACEPQVECTPAPRPSSGDKHQDCVDRINQFRVGCWCLPALERWTEAEACANQHAEYDAVNDRAHAGLADGICENSGRGQNECPGWPGEDEVIEGCLQSMYDEGPPPTEECKGQCFQDHGHFLNMTAPDRTKVACGFFTTAEGAVWSVQNFR